MWQGITFAFIISLACNLRWGTCTTTLHSVLRRYSIRGQVSRRRDRGKDATDGTQAKERSWWPWWPWEHNATTWPGIRGIHIKIHSKKPSQHNRIFGYIQCEIRRLVVFFHVKLGCGTAWMGGSDIVHRNPYPIMQDVTRRARSSHQMSLGFLKGFFRLMETSCSTISGWWFQRFMAFSSLWVKWSNLTCASFFLFRWVGSTSTTQQFFFK